ncbi:hypothetical protein Pan44_17800 [Caulifigura coniformis]|uniref:VWFA domain-containing protein n=2 Tax=Caulifigura coniformis TaxID=2527983 RepID=A0A517SC92_9PLAN|nr:hypothetical protein Pan44_17800 [Caulifigura coniformis]
MHLAAAWILWQLAQSPGCQARRGEQVSEGREVGIVVRERGPEDPREVGASPPAAEANPSASTDETRVEAAVAPTISPEIPLSLPSVEAPGVIGLGPMPAFAAQAARGAGGPVVQNTGLGGRGEFGSGQGSRNGAGNGNGTTMYGVTAKGRRFVYVIDRSSSMTDVLRSAKNELMASLRRLDESQEFQVIFFNNSPHELKKNRFVLFNGSESDRQLVEDQLSGISASGGTNRVLALETALELRPDVIYFLTDSEDEMTAAQREGIRKRLRGAQINCIEFGSGRPVTGPDGKQAPNFLHKLAKESGGGYAYFDITGGASR